MNKIVLQVGFLVFFISVIIFSQQGIPLKDILIRSLFMFLALSIMLTILVLIVIKSINKTSAEKQKELSENILGEMKNE